jgi:hypothetical protein
MDRRNTKAEAVGRFDVSETMPLFFESVNEALRQIVVVLGGAKKVGATMRPELPADQAANWLLACLNPDRRERLDPDQVVWLLRQAREAGYHQSMAYLAEAAGYKVEPITPAETRDRLADAIVQATATLQQAMRLAQHMPADPQVRAVK